MGGIVPGRRSQPDTVTMVVPVFPVTGGMVVFFVGVNVLGWALADGALVMCAVFAAMAAMAAVRYARGRWFPNVLFTAVFSSAAIMIVLLVTKL